MARYWRGTIDSIALEEGSGNVCGFNLDGAEAFAYIVTGSSIQAATGLVHTQYAPFLYGKPLEIHFLHIPQALLNTLLTALKATLPGGTSVACSFTDDFQTITGQFKPNVPQWYKRGEPDGAYIQDAILRLIYTGA